MRSFDRAMPEELNRVLADHASDLLLCSTETAVDEPASARASPGEVAPGGRRDGRRVAGVPPIAARALARRSRELGLEPGDYLLVTAHRAGNVDDPARLAQLVELLEALPRPVVLPLHPRTRARLEAAGLLGAARGGRRSRRPRRWATSTSSSWRARPRGPDRLRRRPEGGLPARRAVRDAARHHRVGRDRRRGLEHARGPRPRGRAGRARARRARRRAARAVRRRPAPQSGFGDVLAAYTPRAR